MHLDISVRQIKINVTRRYNIFIGKGRDGIDFVFCQDGTERNKFFFGLDGTGLEQEKKLFGIGTSREVPLRTLITIDSQYYSVLFDSNLPHKCCFNLKFGLRTSELYPLPCVFVGLKSELALRVYAFLGFIFGVIAKDAKDVTGL